VACFLDAHGLTCRHQNVEIDGHRMKHHADAAHEGEASGRGDPGHVSAHGLIERFYGNVWNRWDDEEVDAVLAADVVFRGSLGDEVGGRDGFRAYRDKVRAAFPDFHNEVLAVLVDGDHAAVRLRCTGRHDGELFGVPATGRQVVYHAAAFLTIDDRQIRGAWVLGDLDALRRQLVGSS